MKKLITLTAIIFCTFGALFAETPENRKENPHEIRIGIADSYMEACLENGGLRFKTVAPYPYQYGPLNHTGHIFVDYQYRINNWFSAGVNIDYLHSWYYVYPNLGQDFDKKTNSGFKLTILPTLKFTYFHNEMIDLYSSFGIGGHFFYNNYENFYMSRNLGIAFDACALGIAVGKKQWFGAFELGGTTAICFPIVFRPGSDCMQKRSFEMPIPFARLIRVSVGYRF